MKRFLFRQASVKRAAVAIAFLVVIILMTAKKQLLAGHTVGDQERAAARHSARTMITSTPKPVERDMKFYRRFSFNRRAY